MEKRHYKELIRGYRDRTLSREELAVYHQLLSEGKLDESLLEEMDLDLDAHHVPSKSVTKRLIFRQKSVSIAAAILVFLGIGLSIWGYQTWFGKAGSNELVADSNMPEDDRIPVMHLADGTSIRFDSASQQENSQFAYNGDEDLLIYKAVTDQANKQAQASGQYHRVETPPGRNYKIQLEDGTTVWLNASSSIRFPVYFGTKERSVEITGEVYFEVAHERARPFQVKAGPQTVEVLGTKFNVNSYQDEPGITTTLLEGKVNLSAGNRHYLMSPNDQAVLRPNTSFDVRKVDAKSTIAWTNGFLQFRNESLERILKKVSRWYSVELQLDPALASGHYSLRFNQHASLEDLVVILNEAGVPAKIENGNLMVGKNL